MALIDNVVGAYHLDDSGSTVTDATGTSDGTATGTSSVAGKIDNARDFNGSSDDIFLERVAPTNNQKSFAFWVNTDNAAGNTFPFSIGYTPSTISGRGGFGINSNKVEFFQAGEATLQSTTTISDGNWYLIVGVKDGTSGKIYINGVEEDSTNSWTAANMIGDLTLGRLTSTYFNGQIDEVLIWNRAITQEEITELWNSSNGFVYPFTNDVTISPSAFSLSTSEQAPSLFIDISQSAVFALTAGLPVPMLDVPEENPNKGTVSTKEISKLTIPEGIGDVQNLIPQGINGLKSTVLIKNRVGLEL